MREANLKTIRRWLPAIVLLLLGLGVAVMPSAVEAQERPRDRYRPERPSRSADRSRTADRPSTSRQRTERQRRTQRQRSTQRSTPRTTQRPRQQYRPTPPTRDAGRSTSRDPRQSGLGSRTTARQPNVRPSSTLRPRDARRSSYDANDARLYRDDYDRRASRARRAGRDDDPYAFRNSYRYGRRDYNRGLYNRPGYTRDRFRPLLYPTYGTYRRGLYDRYGRRDSGTRLSLGFNYSTYRGYGGYGYGLAYPAAYPSSYYGTYHAGPYLGYGGYYRTYGSAYAPALTPYPNRYLNAYDPLDRVLDPYPYPGHNVQSPRGVLGYGRGLDPAYPTYRRYPRSVGYFGATYGRPFYPAYDHPGSFYFGAALRLNF